MTNTNPETNPGSAARECRLVPARGGRLACAECHATFDAEDVTVLRAERREQASDPEYQTIRFELSCDCPLGLSRCQSLDLPYGATASPETAAVMSALSTARSTTGTALRSERTDEP